MTPREIVWTEGRFSTTGAVDGIELFSFGWDAMRSRGEEAEKPYIISTYLPGMKNRIRVASADAAKDIATRMLAQFIDRLTVQP